MSTTPLKLPQDVKQLAIAAAKHQGVSPHAFMVDAIREAAINAGKRNRFVSDALAAQTQALDSGKGYAAEDVYDYLRARVREEPTNRPKAKVWRR